MNKLLRITVTTMTLLVLLLGSSIAAADGPIDPSEITVELYPGESYEVEKEVTTPSIPPKLDLLLLEDETGSFWDDIEAMQGTQPDCSDGLANAIFEGISAQVSDFQAGVAGFRDFDQDAWGGSADWVYRLLQDLTSDKATWLAGICGLSASGGADGPEAQLAALKSAAEGVAWDSNGDGDLDDPNDTPAGQNPSWRSDGVTRVVVLVTDASYHVAGDGCIIGSCPPGGWPGPTFSDTVDELNDEGIHVIVLTTSYSATVYQSLADETGGNVKLIADDSSDIVDAILEALEELTSDVWWEALCDPGVSVDLDPVVQYDVSGGDSVIFNEEISVAEGTGFGTYQCTVTFYANEYPEDGVKIGIEEISIYVPAVPVDIKPTSCRNPLNVKEKGVLPVAILGIGDFDVSMVDPATVELMAVAPLRWNMEDVATPFEPYMGKLDAFDCTEEGPDGYMDLTFKFDAQEVVAALGEVNDGDVLVLSLTGNLKDGRAIAGEDVVVILKKGKD